MSTTKTTTKQESKTQPAAIKPPPEWLVNIANTYAREVRNLLSQLEFRREGTINGMSKYDLGLDDPEFFTAFGEAPLQGLKGIELELGRAYLLATAKSAIEVRGVEREEIARRAEQERIAEERRTAERERLAREAEDRKFAAMEKEQEALREWKQKRMATIGGEVA